jgi:phosphatidylglycerophosphate synthase
MSSASGKWLRGRSSACGETTVDALRKSYGAKESSDRADSYVSRFIYRPVSFYLTIPFVWTGCSANQVTMLRIVLALLSAVLVATKFRSLVLFGSSLYAFCVLLDYVDGNLARLNGTASEFGGLLEELADQVGPSLFPLAIGVGLYFRPDRLLRLVGSVDPVWALLVGALTSISYCLSAMAHLYIRVIQNKATSAAARLPVPGAHSNRLRVLQRALHLSRLGITEGVYLAIVFGIVLAAALDFMSIYLVARGIRNLTFLFLWIRRLVARLSEVRAGACH